MKSTREKESVSEERNIKETCILMVCVCIFVRHLNYSFGLCVLHFRSIYRKDVIILLAT